ncbi:SEC7-like protein [Cordyceps fumosorosea ARSEF 2679]|uniref:SEC7-like protein n=1 Tax=Cordyceps fumosorosea (strain ARSEF 2679) TaxID=1081104 RepID=A0A168CP89_CORFA|nr:SEC7-like protein [Cordyceps fumosorosea ARSEF 2679]OAA71621.1 SEC7-like protein [Cordyceps fumosorosea ARSEF 2679]
MASDHYRYHQHRRRRGDSSGSSSMIMPQTPQQRDSHDLSLSPRDVTRDSLVTNMLLSLDQFSFDQQHQQQLQQQQSPFDHRSHWDPSPSNHSPGQPQHHHQNHRYHQAFDGAPPPRAHSSSSPSVGARPAASFSRPPEANSYHHHRDRGQSYSSVSSNLSTPPNARGHNPDKAAASNRRAPNTSSSASSSTVTATQREQVGAANASLQAALASTPIRSTQKQKKHIPPVTPPARGASLSSHDLSLDQRPSRVRRVPKHLHDGYHEFLTETVPSSATASSSSRRDPTRRSKSAGGSSSRQRAAAAAASGATGSPAQSRPPLPLASSSIIEYDVDYLSQDYGAAPTPTVPAGPRRRTSNLGPRGASFDHLPPPGIERKRSSRTLSLRSISSKKKHAATSWDQQKQQQQQQSQPPMPGTDDFEPAPAPSVGYRKTKDDQHRAKSSHAAFPHHHHPDLPHQQPPQKERPGFFRRVFGGGNSSRNVLAATEQPPQPNSPRPPSSLSRPQSGKLIKEQSKSTSGPPSRDTSSSHSQQPPPVPPLQKKTSSFFRRRKKSVVDDAPPLPSQIPPVPNVPLTTLTKKTSSGTDDASPVSSLRQALDPYLRSSAGSGVGAAKPSALADITNIAADDAREDETDEPRSEFKREFSPDYEPSPNAKIRSVPSDTENNLDSPSRKTGAGTKKSKSAANQTFLDLDNGSDDDHAGKVGNRRSKSDLSASTHSESSHVSQQDTSKDDTIRASKMAPRITEQLSLGTSRSRSNLRLPSDGNRSVSAGSMSTDTDYKSVLSAPPSVRVEDLDETDSSKGASTAKTMQAKGLDEPLFVVGEPTEDDRLKAKKIYDGLQDFIPKDKAAAWMGEEGPVRKRTLQAYMELYSFTDQSILSALRSICGRLILRAETQQVDRILVAFSKRWCDCNPNHGFKATDIIHTICYSIMLLNTDLHMADIETKMTRSQFVKNTLSTIRQSLHESNPDAFQRPSILPDRSPMTAADSTSGEQDRSTFRHSFRPPPRPDAQGGDPSEDSGPLVRNGLTGTLRAWEEQIELVLKSIYASIRDDRLPLFGAEDRPVGPAQSQSNLSVMGLLKRTPSVLSKAPSEGQMSSRGRIADGVRTGASRWTSKSRSRPGLGRNGMASSRTSFDDDNSLWSPAMSSATWSRYSLGRTQASMSQDSFASSMPRGDFQRSIGFANALSQSIIRDEDLNGDETAPSIISSDYTTAQMLEDESLELAGPPWIKEGMVVHKHHLDGVGKRAKDRNWSEVFAVVQKGQLSMFSFNLSKSARHKARPRTAMAPVGGGNWQDNAVNVGTFNLRLTLASALPTPGYSRTRPYVWALSLPTGAVHLFQVGTPEIIREFVNTTNYWSARLSSHPLVGGISNIEYGWSEAIVNNALVAAINESSSPPPSATQKTAGSTLGHARKSSTQSASAKSLSFDHSIGGGSNSGFTNNSGRGKLPGDRVHIAPWSPPTQSARPSNLSEDEQREALAAYVRSIESDLQAHNQLRSPMLLAYTPRGTNAAKAMTNWESKSSYLLREIVKFRTYVDCLNQAETRRREVYKERALAQRAARGDLSEPDDDDDDDAGANETLRP